ncbi:MAG: acyl-CoA reductase [Bacteroidales bacterium]
MSITERIESFSELGEVLRIALAGKTTKYTASLEKLIAGQQARNPWFIPAYVRMAIQAIADELTYENLVAWTSRYPGIVSVNEPLNAAIIMAGNIPLAGFHDFLCTLITGNNVIAKTSSKDPDLIVFVADILCNINNGFRKRITITDNLLKGFDAVIASGSTNSSRYFEYYFGRYPHIIRKNRNSAGILQGNETAEEIGNFGKDIFSYFGLGCRNVSKIYIPEEYDLTEMIPAWDQYSWLKDHNKYANNYDFHKAIYLINMEKFMDTGYVLMKESSELASPVAVLYYERYKSEHDVFSKIDQMADKIQCIVGKKHVPFGSAQRPGLWDYADRIDTIEFLLKKNHAGIS